MRSIYICIVPSLRFIPVTLPLGLQRPSVTLVAYFHCFRRIVCVELFLKKPIHLHGIVLYIAQGNLLHSVTAKFISTYHLSINAACKATKLITRPSNPLWHTSGNRRSLPPSVIKSAGSVQFKYQETGNGKTRIWWGQGCHVDADHTQSALWSAECS
jgi:hypothetical protein